MIRNTLGNAAKETWRCSCGFDNLLPPDPQGKRPPYYRLVGSSCRRCGAAHWFDPRFDPRFKPRKARADNGAESDG